MSFNKTGRQRLALEKKGDKLPEFQARELQRDKDEHSERQRCENGGGLTVSLLCASTQSVLQLKASSCTDRRLTGGTS